MESIAQVADAMRTVLTDVAVEAGRTSGFVQRRSKLDGATFVQALVFGFQGDPQATLEQLTQAAVIAGTVITPQGLAQRFGSEAAACLRQVLEAAGRQLVSAAPQASGILQRFTGVYLHDSTTLSLPTALADLWPGCGGKGSAAALKVQVQWNYLRGDISHLSLHPGRAQDRAAPFQHTSLPAGALRLADLGYFSLDVLAACDQQGVYWLTRYHPQAHLYSAQGHPLDLVPWLQRHAAQTGTLMVQLGAQHHLRCRLLAVRVPQAVADCRRQRLRDQARQKGQTVSARTLALADWTLLLTNAPPDLLSLEEAVVLGRVRWQIELLFKRWKSGAGLGHSRSQQPWTILCEVYAKLLGILLHHWQLLVCGWALPTLSYAKAQRLLQQHTCLVAHALPLLTQLVHALHAMERVLASSCRLNKRHTHPATFQLLDALDPLLLHAQVLPCAA
jgi:succinate dehydrogenase hydrophobic anchor subunit